MKQEDLKLLPFDIETINKNTMQVKATCAYDLHSVFIMNGDAHHNDVAYHFLFVIKFNIGR